MTINCNILIYQHNQLTGSFHWYKTKRLGKITKKTTTINFRRVPILLLYQEPGPHGCTTIGVCLMGHLLTWLEIFCYLMRGCICEVWLKRKAFLTSLRFSRTTVEFRSWLCVFLCNRRVWLIRNLGVLCICKGSYPFDMYK